jgi:2-methylcitrate dehydratase PrpD
MTATAALGDFIASSRSVDVPNDVRELARRHVLDTLASTVACRDLDPSVVARRYALANSGTNERGVTILGTQDRASLVDAAFAGAMTAHGAEINDFMPSVFVQPGPAIVSGAIALAEQRHLSGDALVRGIVTGYEVAVRVPRALGVGNLRRAGIANHGIGPMFGTAATAASMAGLSADDVSHVLSCCAQQASGSWQWLLDVEHMEKSFVFAGLGARNGMQAVLLVEAGFRGVRAPLDQEGGWFSGRQFQGGDAEPDALVAGWDELTALADTAYKRYPVGGPTQPAIEALLSLVEEVDPAEVASVEIAMPGRWQAFRDAEMPALNLRYLTSIILIDGRLDFHDAQSLERMHGDESVAGRMATVDVVHDPDQESGTGRERTESARVTLTLRSGDTVERYVGHVVGFPSHPMSGGDVEAKALELVTPHLGADRGAELVDTCRRLDELPDAGSLAGLIAR